MEDGVKVLDLNMVSFGKRHLFVHAFCLMKCLITWVLVTDMLVELARREKMAGIKPDGDLDIFMKVLVLATDVEYVRSSDC